LQRLLTKPVTTKASLQPISLGLFFFVIQSASHATIPLQAWPPLCNRRMRRRWARLVEPRLDAPVFNVVHAGGRSARARPASERRRQSAVVALDQYMPGLDGSRRWSGSWLFPCAPRRPCSSTAVARSAAIAVPRAEGSASDFWSRMRRGDFIPLLQCRRHARGSAGAPAEGPRRREAESTPPRRPAIGARGLREVLWREGQSRVGPTVGQIIASANYPAWPFKHRAPSRAALTMPWEGSQPSRRCNRRFTRRHES